ncbi:polysialyltransferase family glycosyltransferase [Halomonas llamarensis]|uniref:Glycosyltransferase 52 family protein n=1 Tax=Halomonas llamarensis TaxID=2945104 RepID=A0ABT0SU87_9GAMM|nr:polysialyltransferase family glycosyltransferase [Halomonas llamarensis]MCL7931404.1 hypothetical protein [Halomonas llamarensis]
MSRHHLALITSPLQLINLRQLCVERGLYKKDLILVVKFSKKSSSAQALQNELILDYGDWGDIIIFENKNKFFYLQCLIKKLRPTKWETVISGELTSWWQNIVFANLRFEERIIVDDGTMTLFDYHEFFEKGVDYQKKKFGKSIFLSFLRIRTKIKKPWPITVFSLFPLASNEYVKCEKNSLSVLKTTSDKPCECLVGIPKKHLFLGQPFVDNKEISDKEYFDIVSHFSFQSKNECWYLPHRSESKETLDKIKEIKNLKVMTYTQPVEKIVGQQKNSYSQIAGINSTALFTLHILYPEIPICFYSIREFSSASKLLLQRSLVIEDFIKQQENTFQLSCE